MMNTEHAVVPLRRVETLWFQLTGTLCNLTCTHCFIACSPRNDLLPHMTRDQVRRHLDAARELGTREFYATGGEPLLHREFLAIVDDILAVGPLTILTNGILVTRDLAESMAATARRHGHPLDFRVSIDGPDADSNDAIRGHGSFRRALRGVGHLVAAGFRPILTMMRSWDIADDDIVLDCFGEALAGVGYRKARVKLLPVLRMGAESDRSRPYREDERVTARCIDGYDLDRLMCHHTRLVSARGVHVCPILVGEESSLLGHDLKDGLGPYALDHPACFTCVTNGAICSNDHAVRETGAI